ncbi:MAG: flagellar basal body rod protein FlgB [Pseudomonadota bacterium]
MNWIDNALNIDSQVLYLRARRAEVLASNLANADTPGYRAQDIDFKSVMDQLRSGDNLRPASKEVTPEHFNLSDPMASSIYERDTGKRAANGNTVSREFEQAQFSQNAVEYLASLRFVSGNIASLKKALRGE